MSKKFEQEEQNIHDQNIRSSICRTYLNNKFKKEKNVHEENVKRFESEHEKALRKFQEKKNTVALNIQKKQNTLKKQFYKLNECQKGLQESHGELTQLKNQIQQKYLNMKMIQAYIINEQSCMQLI